MTYTQMYCYILSQNENIIPYNEIFIPYQPKAINSSKLRDWYINKQVKFDITLDQPSIFLPDALYGETISFYISPGTGFEKPLIER